MRQNSEQEQQTKESKDSITTVKIVNPDSPVVSIFNISVFPSGYWNVFSIAENGEDISA